jgi:hypothetical protein
MSYQLFIVAKAVNLEILSIKHNVVVLFVCEAMVGIAIPASFPIPGFGIGVDGIPEHNAHVIMDSNPGIRD